MATTAKDKPRQALTATTWEGQVAEVLDGVEVLDKAELLGKPFAITAIKLTVNDRDVSFAWAEGKFTPDGEPFTFNDSSKDGVRGQILDYLVTKGKVDILDEWYEPAQPIFIPRGLRVSRYEKEVPNNRGGTEWKKVATFYLTTSGRRA